VIRKHYDLQEQLVIPLNLTGKVKLQLDLFDLGEVKDCARVKLNGKDFGTLLGPTLK
jgi:hypothetical protein